MCLSKKEEQESDREGNENFQEESKMNVTTQENSVG